MKQTCSDIQKELPDFLDNSLDPALRTGLEEHLQSCIECREYAEFLAELSQSVDLTEEYDPGEEFWLTLKSNITERVFPHKKRDISVAGWFKRFILTPIPRPVFIGIGIACMILLMVVVNPYFRNEQPEFAELEIGNPISDPWFNGGLVTVQELVSGSESELNVVDIVFEDTLSESSYTEIFDGTIFNFLSQLSEEDYETFSEFL
jgi:hypothetical protein